MENIGCFPVEFSLNNFINSIVNSDAVRFLPITCIKPQDSIVTYVAHRDFFGVESTNFDLTNSMVMFLDNFSPSTSSYFNIFLNKSNEDTQVMLYFYFTTDKDFASPEAVKYFTTITFSTDDQLKLIKTFNVGASSELDNIYLVKFFSKFYSSSMLKNTCAWLQCNIDNVTIERIK